MKFIFVLFILFMLFFTSNCGSKKEEKIILDSKDLESQMTEAYNKGLKALEEGDVLYAAKNALAHNFIAKLPGGYNYVLRENGSNLSGGQRQAISLARAIIKRPKILVLDEPTSSMDSENEQGVINNLYALEQKPSIIISSHKINILTKVDKIAVILNGKIVNFGPTNEIIKTGSN